MKKLMMLLWLSFALVGCTANGLKGLAESPDVKVDGVRLAKLSFTSADAILSLRVRNPNSFTIPLRGLDYALSLNNVSVAKSSLQKNINLSARQTRVVEIPVSFKIIELIQTVPSIVRSRDFTYQLKGNTHFPFINIPFSRVGRVGK